MKTFQNLSLSLVIVLLLLFTACGSRKLNEQKNQIAEKARASADVKTSLNVDATHTDKSVQRTKETEQSKVVEGSGFTASADSAEYNANTGNVKLKGNVKVSGKSNKQTDNNKSIEKELLNDLSDTYQAAELKDSSVLSKYEASAQNSNRDLDVKRGFNWWLLLAAIPVVIIGGFALKASLK